MASTLILASQSPRRQQLLQEAGYEFQVLKPDEAAELAVPQELSPEDFVTTAAEYKARNVAEKVASGLILAADTIAECNGQKIGKPRDRDHAREILNLLIGRRHRVLTGVVLWHCPSNHYSAYREQTWVGMNSMSSEVIEEYLDTELWRGKAGAFGYQDGIDWINVTDGLVSTVVGLPVEKLPGWIAALQQQVAQED